MDLFGTRETRTDIYSGRKYTGTSIHRSSGILTAGFFSLMGYLIITGAIGWDDQLKWLLLIGVGIWVLVR
jgi:hypothetical protein